jgi:hypothetical protein
VDSLTGASGAPVRIIYRSAGTSNAPEGSVGTPARLFPSRLRRLIFSIAPTCVATKRISAHPTSPSAIPPPRPNSRQKTAHPLPSFRHVEPSREERGHSCPHHLSERGHVERPREERGHSCPHHLSERGHSCPPHPSECGHSCPPLPIAAPPPNFFRLPKTVSALPSHP